MKTLLIYLVLSLSAFSDSGRTELPTVPKVDLNQYLGRWYEIAAIPQFFQKKCVKNTSANYSLSTEDNLIHVLNSCETKDGSMKEAKGAARVVDTQSNSKLEVTFVRLFDWVFSFGGDYWIVDLDDNYSYALIGHPKRSYAWILSREPQLSQEKLARINAKLIETGYDSCTLMMSIQDGGHQSRQPLCELFPK